MQGLYNVELDWTPENGAAVDASKPSLFTAIQEQLGLRLEPRRDSIEVLVIDSIARKPSEN